MSHLNGHFTQVANREMSTDGSVFRGRFHNKIVTDPGHWRYLLTYLHMNPVNARLVMRINQWRWTSHAFYNGQKTPPDWLTTSDLHKQYGGVEGYRQYLKEVRQGRRERPADFGAVLFSGRRSSEMSIVKQDETPRSLKLGEAVKQVLKVANARKEDLFREVKGRGGNPVRTVAAWWLAMGAGIPNREVGKRFNMSQVAVSRAIGRVRREVAYNPTGKIAEWACVLKEKNG